MRYLAVIMMLIVLAAGSALSKPAADFKLKDLSGNEVSLSDYQGKVVVLNFWATWCGPCIHEMPALEKLQQTYKEDIQLLGLTIASKMNEIPQRVKETGVTYPILLDADKVVADYGSFNSIPQTFIIDRQGNVVTQLTGAKSYEQFENEIKKVIE